MPQGENTTSYPERPTGRMCRRSCVAKTQIDAEVRQAVASSVPSAETAALKTYSPSSNDPHAPRAGETMSHPRFCDIAPCRRRARCQRIPAETEIQNLTRASKPGAQASACFLTLDPPHWRERWHAHTCIHRQNKVQTYVDTYLRQTNRQTDKRTYLCLSSSLCTGTVAGWAAGRF